MASAFVIIILIVVAVLAVVNPVVGLAAYFSNLLIGLSIRFPQLENIPVMGILPSLILLGWLFNSGRINGFRTKFPAKHDKMLFGYLTAEYFGTFLYDGFMSMVTGLQFLPLRLLLFLGPSRMIYSVRMLKLFIAIIVLTIVALSIEGIAYIADVEMGEEASVSRFLGFGRYQNPNEKALIMNMAMPFLLLAMRDAGLSLRSFFYAGCLMSTTYLTILTVSRAGFLGFVAMLTFSLTGKKRIKQIIVAVLLKTAVMPMVSPEFMDRMGSISYSERDASSEQRITAWREGRGMIKSHPLFGVGRDNFIEYHHLQPHNSLILVAAETGLIGAFFWVMLIVLAFKSLQRTGKMGLTADDDQRFVARTAQALKLALIGFLTTAFFGNQAYNPFLMLFLALPHILERMGSEMKQKELEQ